MSKALRIAVRKFGPFESAIEKIWNSFCAKSGCTLSLEMVPMDLHPLYDSILEKGGLLRGEWDMAHINTDWLFEGYTSGALENLAPYIAENPPEDFPAGWSQSLLTMQQSGEAIFGLPFHDGPECLVYRKDLFEDETEKQRFLKLHGKELQLPETWQDFKQVAEFFQRPADNLYGSVFAGYPDGHNTVFDFCLQLWTRNGELTDAAGNVNINTTAALEGLSYYRQLLQEGSAIHPRSKEFDSVDSGFAFARGEVAMMVNWFGFASMCEVIEESKVQGKVNITNLPTGNNGKTASLNVYWLYAVGAGSANKQIAYDFIRYAVNKQNDQLLTMEGGIGCRISTWEDEEVNRRVPYYHRLGALHENAKSLPLKSNWAKIASVIDEVVLQTVNTDIAIEEILQQGQQKIELLG